MAAAGVAQGRGVGLGHPLRHPAAPVERVDQEQHDVSVGGRGERRLAHVTAQRTATILHARRVDVRDLRLQRRPRPAGVLGEVERVHPEDAVARGLRLGRHRDQVAIEDAVEQGRLADVRQSDDRAEASTDLVGHDDAV